LRIGVDLLSLNKADFVQNDLHVETQRVFGRPIALYESKDVSETTDRYDSQTTARISTAAVSILNGAPVLAYVSIRSGFDEHAADRRTPTAAPASTVLEQGWISTAGFTAGLRQSFFDFSTGYSLSGGYGSNRTTNLIAYEKGFGKGTVAMSIEDGSSRRYQEGVWALYGSQVWPDAVLRGRYNPEWGTVHVAGAVHPIHDALSGDEALGWALNAGFEVRKKWSDVFGAGAGDSGGRFLLTGAYGRGALDYIGVPRFSTDYVVDSDGNLVLTEAMSGSASYEHIWTSSFKTSATLALYRTQATLKDFDWTVEGAMAQLGADYSPAPGIQIGGELSYFWDTAQGVYFGDVPGAETSVGFLQALFYIRRSI
jgi:hypothetical protein